MSDEPPTQQDAAAAQPSRDQIDRQGLIATAAESRSDPVVAETYLGKFKDGGSKPVKLRCSDGQTYAVKGRQAGRMIFNDQVAANLGKLIHAAVPDVTVAEVPQALIDANPNTMKHMKAGTAHASKEIEGCSGRLGIEHADDGNNRERFARLAVFFGWMGGGDQQFIYNNAKPHLVHSVDHGHFFHGGPNWTSDGTKQAPLAQVDAELMKHCQFTSEELRDACAPLLSVTTEQIAEAVAAPPDDWGVSMNERIALAEYLERRRAELVAAYAGDETQAPIGPSNNHQEEQEAPP